MSTQSLAAVNAHFSRVIHEVAVTHERVTVTKNGSPVAVIFAIDDFESLLETLAILSDRPAVADIREAERQMAEGQEGKTSRTAGGRRARLMRMWAPVHVGQAVPPLASAWRS
jgi:prevent-host-death family protein